MAAPSLEEFIAEHKLFAMLDPPGREKLAALGTVARHGPAEVIVQEGEPGEALFILTAGTVQVEVESFGQVKTIAELGPGAVFGEIASLTVEPRTATVRASTEVQVLRFAREPLLALLEAYPNALGTLRRLGIRRSEETLGHVLGD